MKLSFVEGVGYETQGENPLRLHRAMGCAADGRIGGMLTWRSRYALAGNNFLLSTDDGENV